MDWVDRMNKAIGYIEDRLAGEVDYEAAARIACCSTYHFQRMFSFIAGVSLSEYVRRRRLTLAAFELQNGKIKVIDLALKYGYESPEAFARAFQNLHGTTPTAARSAGAKLKAYPRISFQISIQGVAEMNYRIEEMPGFSIVGVQEKVPMSRAFEVVPGLWANAAQDGLFGRLWDIRADDHPVSGILGVCADGDFGRNEEFHYVLSIVSDRSPPEGMTKRDFPAATWAVFEAEGGPEGLAELWRRLYTEWVPVSGYELAYVPAIERYLPPEENRNELWVAVVPK
ncbi:AraC family transcriptional regulator [Cohnella xylanilytica]|uniref:AraC family transcriptional regulator n=1 Tax=Cohnella xylanilytica TaxID=557555 RepID=A0A841TZL4_9BACL|nr:AraC family transcriptional regulator [Cohnella xylanilytica]MBB6691104.1 AraC family transcriptional regulator [Cohnella xylanilytica]